MSKDEVGILLAAIWPAVRWFSEGIETPCF